MNPMITTTRPGVGEYAASFADYVGRIAEDEDIVAVLVTQLDQILARLGRISEARGDYRYAPDKWSIRQLVGHIEDSERVFAYRALSIARGETQPLPGFDQNSWMVNAPFDSSTLRDRAESLASVRRSTIQLFRALDDAAWERSGLANDNAVSVRALAYTTVGHERHHINLLRDRYLAAMLPP